MQRTFSQKKRDFSKPVLSVTSASEPINVEVKDDEEVCLY